MGESRIGAILVSLRAPFGVFVLALFVQFLIKPWLGADGAFYGKLLLDCGIAAMLAASLTMVNGFTGQFSMGHAAFMAVGAYTAAGITYYASAKIIGDETFADANRHSGVVSTMLDERGEWADPEGVSLGSSGMVLVAKPDALLPGRSYELVLTRTEMVGGEEKKTLAGRWRFRTPQSSLSLGQSVGTLPATIAARLEGVTRRQEMTLLPGLITRLDGVFVLALLAGGLVAAGCGYVVGLPSLRLRGDYLAIVTLGFGEIVRVLIQSQTNDVLWDVNEIKGKSWWELGRALGGPVGFTGLPFYTSLFWVVLCCGLTLVVAYRLKASTFGRAFLSIREDEIAAEAMGVDTTKFKIRAFVLSAFFAGIAGGLYAHTVGVQLNAGELGFVKSFDIIIMVVLGGLGSISGAVIAAIILTLLPELLRDFAQYRMVSYAVALILMMILRPKGLFGSREVWEKAAWGRKA